jgi:hypothetical protein
MAYGVRFLGLFLLLYTASRLGADIGGLGSNVTGTWTVRISTPSGRIFSTAELTQSGNQVKGWLEAYGGERIPLSGVLISDKLIVTTHPKSRRIVAFDRCELKAGGNSMTGTFYPGKGKIEFIRVREPRIQSSPRSWHPHGATSVR